MAIVKGLIVLIAIVSVHGIQREFSVSELCEYTAAYFNFINRITPMKLEVNFQEGNPLLYGPGSIEFSSDVKIKKCDDLKVDGSSILINAELMGDLTVHTSERKEFKVDDCLIVTATLLDRKGNLVFVQTPLIEVREYRTIHMTTVDVGALMDELVKPFLSRALTDSRLSRTFVVGPSVSTDVSAKTTTYLKKIVNYFTKKSENNNKNKIYF